IATSVIQEWSRFYLYICVYFAKALLPLCKVMMVQASKARMKAIVKITKTWAREIWAAVGLSPNKDKISSGKPSMFKTVKPMTDTHPKTLTIRVFLKRRPISFSESVIMSKGMIENGRARAKKTWE